MTWVAGVDGCRGLGKDGVRYAWVVVEAQLDDGRVTAVEHRLARDLNEVTEAGRRPTLVALDIPIGLLSRKRVGGRVCDQAVRRMMPGKGSSVFSPPLRGMLGMQWAEVSGISIQAFHIMPKIAAVDAWMTPERQKRVIEAHPELAFAQLAGAPMQGKKKQAAGRQERLSVLDRVLPQATPWFDAFPYPRTQVAVDDLIDACVLVETARHAHLGSAICVPPDRPRDARGLEMVIWAPPAVGR